MSDPISKAVPTAGGELARVLVAAQNGDSRAAEELLPLVYEELRRLAAHR